MELHGSLTENLYAALASMRRLKGRQVHPDTVDYWYQLIAHTRLTVRKGRASIEIEKLLNIVSDEFTQRLAAHTPPALASGVEVWLWD